MAKVNVSFNLKKPSSPKETPIRCIIRYSGQRLVYYFGESIHPKFWDSQKQRPKNTRAFPGYLDLTYKINNLESHINKVFSDYQYEHGLIPSTSTLKALINNQMPQLEKEPDIVDNSLLFPFIDKFIEERPFRLNPTTQKPYAPRTIKAYNATRQHLLDFAEESGKKYFTFDDIDINFYLAFTDWLITKKELTTNTVGKHVKYLKTFLNEALSRGFTSNVKFKNGRFKVVKEDVDHVYLSEEEIKRIYEVDLTKWPGLDRVRDLFIVGCWTGLRFSDVTNIQAKNFVDDGDRIMLNITTQKTANTVWVPIHPMVKAIMRKYEGITANSLPKAISNQKMNKYLKEVAKLAQIDTLETIKKTKAGKVVAYTRPKYELISTHTARRSFATNQYLAGVPPYTIMQVTGHKTESAFLRYIKITPKEHALKMAQLWEKRLNLTL